ncbi:MAG: UvrD-helicase domain-containing protein [Lentisphaeria bacterium]|nr:UvrD-helicase domain-containing protein [Lentisphaeria bacterium]
MNPAVSPYLACEIDAGKCAVLEAAAGTGKTYNITNIVARIIMERSDVSIDQMVIVTFTRAAAGELKNRISQRLAVLEKSASTPEADDELLQMALKKGIGIEEIKKRLRVALLNFDRAMIGTIHSFAMRSLSENTFSSNLQFEFTLNEGTSAIIKELCNDFYRSFFYKEENLPLKSSLTKKLIEQYCFKRMADPNLVIVTPQTEIDQNRRLEEELTREESELDDRAAQIPKPSKKDLEQQEKVKQQKEEIKEKRRELEKKKKACQKAIKEATAQLPLYSVLEKAFDYVSLEYQRISKEKNFLGNDDLILKMGEALEDEAFVRQLQAAYPVGLIDEFQDTNDSQFKIFNKIFLENPQSTFLVVGDPRQAIYRFRNCDINTYLEAKNLMCCGPRKARLFNMDVNYRSGAKYIDAINATFTPAGSFAMPDMDMPKQYAAADSKVLLDSEGREIESPIQAAVDLNAPYQKIYDRCAIDIYDLIKANYQLPPTKDRPAPRPVGFGDIAILTNTWNAAAKIRDSLQKCGIPARLINNPNVFATPEAKQLMTFLEGVLNFNNQSALLRAIITPLCDLELPDIKSESAVESRACILNELNSLWHKRSFMLMFNELLTRFNVPERFCARPGGERSLSNLTTIADILGEEQFTRKLTPLTLLNTLQKHIDKAASEEKDSFPGHPETDQGTVIIDTVFGSKGLSYPVVFLPDLFYVSNSFNSDKISHTFHNAGGKLCYAPFISTEDTDLEHDEMIQDNLRKAYVAFTRAQYYCRFYYGNSSKFPRCSSLDWLFRRQGIEGFSQLAAQLKKSAAPLQFPKVTVQEEGKEIEKEIEVINFDFNELSFPEPFAPETGEKLRRSDLFPELLSQSGFLSFSSITPHTGFNNAFADDHEDETDAAEQFNLPPLPEEKQPPQKETCPYLLLPGGTNFGNAVHKIMEISDYRSGDLTDCTAAQLRIHGVTGESAAKHTCEMLQKVLTIPIPDADGKEFTLSDIDPAKKKCEMEFLYKFSNAFSARKLFNVAQKYFEEKFKCICPQSTDVSSFYDNGFFNGSIDLFFEHNGKYYIVDWKTNQLKTLEAYSLENLPAAVAGSRYYVQYMIYTAALFKFLEWRLPAESSREAFYNKYIGGVRYIFVRGVTNDDGHGVFRDRLPYETFKELESIIG